VGRKYRYTTKANMGYRIQDNTLTISLFESKKPEIIIATKATELTSAMIVSWTNNTLLNLNFDT
jgi:hypothetical protein